MGRHKTGTSGTETKPCKTCTKQFEDFISNKRKYCSYTCYHRSLIGKPGKTNRLKKHCTFCGKEFERAAGNFSKRVKNYFCSHPCSAKWWEEFGLHGEDNPNWQGGYSNKTYRNGWNKIKKVIKQRAGGKCEACGGVHKLMDVHHKIPVRLGVDFKIINQFENLQYLCRPCHYVADVNLRGTHPHQKS